METTPAAASESPTPILDRLAPVPPPDKRATRRKVILGSVAGAAAGVAIDVAVWQSPFLWQRIAVPFFQWLDMPWTGPRLLSLALSLLAAVVAALCIHEAGHVVAGLSTGFRFLSVRVGPLVLERPSRISWYWGPGALTSGLASMSAARRDRLRLRAAVYVLGGPAANLLSGGLALALLPALSLPSGLFLTASAVALLLAAIPYQSRIGLTDGGRLWLLWRDRAPCRRWLALMKLQAESREGVLTEARWAKYLAEAVAVRDPTPETVLAHAFAYSAALHKRRDREAGEHLETCLRYLSYAPPVQREGVISDAAVYLARRRKRADLAAQWLADLRTAANPRMRLRAEAAVLEARGDTAGALRKLDEYEASLLALPKGNQQREMLLRTLPGWRSELSDVSSAAAGAASRI
jgi:hypothetical protein